MTFMDDFEKHQDDSKDSQAVAQARRIKALESFSGLMDEITAIFGPDAKAKNIVITRPTNYPVQDLSGPYQAQGLKISFPDRKVVELRPKGLTVGGGYSVEMTFLGCPHNQSHTLIQAQDKTTGEPIWAFLNRDAHGTPQAERWTQEAFENILAHQVLGKRLAIK